MLTASRAALDRSQIVGPDGEWSLFATEVVSAWRTRLASSKKRRVLLMDGEDSRVIRAAAILAGSGLLDPVLLGCAETVSAVAAREGLMLGSRVCVTDPRSFGADSDDLADRESPPTASGRSALAMNLVAAGKVDGCVGGANSRTADVARAAIRRLRKPERLVTSSQFVLMRDGRCFMFADCAVIPDPADHELATIALDAATMFAFLTNDEPRVAMLSYSTKGSGDHPRVQKVREACRIARQRSPELKLDGELQFDAAVDPGVANRKGVGPDVGGCANVFVFPSLESANVGLKICERLAGAVSFGPILHGVSQPVVDLSRGCDVDEIVGGAIIAALGLPIQ